MLGPAKCKKKYFGCVFLILTLTFSPMHAVFVLNYMDEASIAIRNLNRKKLAKKMTSLSPPIIDLSLQDQTLIRSIFAQGS